MKSHVAEIVSAYVRRNHLDQSALPEVIATVSNALASLGQSAPAPKALEPAVPIRRSVTDEAVICLDCGFKAKMLRRHLMGAHGLSPDAYRQRWGLRPDHPLIAKTYSARRSELAKELGLGHTRGADRAQRTKPVG
jgi:predicted transcriptional regulator